MAFTSTGSMYAVGLAIDGKGINGDNSHSGQIAIEPYLHGGLNALIARIIPSSAFEIPTPSLCNAFNDAITLRMTGLQRPNQLVLSWRKVPGASRYDAQVWLVKAAPGQTITPDSEVNIATQTTGPRATLDDATMPAGTYEWRTAAVNAHGSVISHWTPAQTVTLT